MAYLKKSLLNATLLSVFLAAPLVSAEEAPTAEVPENSVISDGKLTKEELAQYAVIGQRQVVYLTEKATDEYSDELADAKPNMPGAWMLLDDGKTVKRINLDSQAGDAPAQVRILMYRAALKSIARRGKINAAAILYTGKVNEDSDKEALVIEHEHRLGISGNKVIPFEVKNGKVYYSEPVTSKKPFQMFYDNKSEALANQG
ncbi:hypothetical protein KFJ24_05250 [Marinobacter sediminum]|uniref:hypothetical protein n=1 Tax=Marinobacter sediminum TaxID=256323 RepID=UPI00202F4AC6|nr:hypothetical protein [Marinobacter sediminum]MCM0611880.1 hypothetical protein [Marinobacter sediminum]